MHFLKIDQWFIACPPPCPLNPITSSLGAGNHTKVGMSPHPFGQAAADEKKPHLHKSSHQVVFFVEIGLACWALGPPRVNGHIALQSDGALLVCCFDQSCQFSIIDSHSAATLALQATALSPSVSERWARDE